MDRIEIKGMEFYGFHGCCPEERKQGQPFFVDVVMELSLEKAGRSDDLGDTVNYARVFDGVRAIVEGPPRNLIEFLAESVAEGILGEHPAVELVRVTVHKPKAPLSGSFRDVAVTVERGRP